jgi:DNA polymerase III epsilon subunit-like protein
MDGDAMTTTQGIAPQRIADTPVAVIDLETTGLTPGFDRIVEVSVVRIDPGEAPRLVFDSLVNPGRRMAATEIHGITDQDVATAPHFAALAGTLIDALQGCAIAAYNAYFDIKFLTAELGEAGIRHAPPYFCLMYLRPMLGLGARCKLIDACRDFGVAYDESHVASHDALAAGSLWLKYLDAIRERGIATYADLASQRRYLFNESFACAPFPDAKTMRLRTSSTRLVSRAGTPVRVDPVRAATATYWDALRTVLADLEVSDAELGAMAQERARGGLQEEQIRMLHARAFASAIMQVTNDSWLDEREARTLRKLHACLARLGWAPGQ